jgi:hypothetical protein
MKFEDDKFKKCSGRMLPVKVPVTADRKTILERSVCKHANHFKDDHENLEYTLIYPDNSEIVHLPGTTEQFLLNKYREDVGRNYNRITIFIATKTDYINSGTPEPRGQRGNCPHCPNSAGAARELNFEIRALFTGI